MNTSYTAQDFGAFGLRVAFGVLLLAHGLLKVMVFTVPGTVDFFASLGLPAVIAYLTIFGEIAGGIALIAGVYTRLTALLTVPIMLGATWAHLGNGWVFSSNGGGWEFPALLGVIAGVVALQGPGAFALKRLPVIDEFVPAALKA